MSSSSLVVSPVNIGANTLFLLSTSGRITSCKRYNCLLGLLGLDVAYIPVNNNNLGGSDHIQPQRFAWALKGMPCLGGAISRDIKHSIIEHLDEIDELSRDVQAVNTVIVRQGKLYGYNTDVLGFQRAIETSLSSNDSKMKLTSAICYGYGGVVNVVVAVLKRLGVERIYISGRRLDEAKKRADELGVMVWSPDVNEGAGIDLFVNASPVTEKPLDQAINFLQSIKNCKAAFDHEMPGQQLISYCTENNVFHISGYEMYYPQMEAQWKLFLEPFKYSHGLDDEKIRSLLKQADELSKTI